MMILIWKGREPKELTEARQELRNTPNATVNYDALHKSQKDAIKQSLLKEQGYICAYCMRRISMDNSKIEHYLPRHPTDEFVSNMHTKKGYTQAQADKKSLDYRNMFAVCMGGEGTNAAEYTCDVARNYGYNRNIPLTVDPLSELSMSKIEYSYSGTIKSSDEKINHDLDVALNLNSGGYGLKESRRQVLESLKRNILEHCGGSDDKKKKQYCSRLRARLSGETSHKREFVGIMIWMLDRWSR